MRQITIDNITYPSMAAACKELNLSWHLVSKEIRNRPGMSAVIDLEEYSANRKSSCKETKEHSKR